MPPPMSSEKQTRKICVNKISVPAGIPTVFVSDSSKFRFRPDLDIMVSVHPNDDDSNNKTVDFMILIFA